MKKLREIARVHIARCEAGDMQAIKELANRLDGRPAQIVDLSDPDSNPIKKIVTEFVHVYETPRRYRQRMSLCRLKGVECVMRMEAAVSMRTPRARNASFDHASPTSCQPWSALQKPTTHESLKN
jgi:hypothetical protein